MPELLAIATELTNCFQVSLMAMNTSSAFAFSSINRFAEVICDSAHSLLCRRRKGKLQFEIHSLQSAECSRIIY